MSQRRGRTADEVRHEDTHGPLDRSRWPKVGDEVLYHEGRGGWVPAIVTDVAEHDGDLCLMPPDGIEALDAIHGPHRHGWLLYGERLPAERVQGEAGEGAE